MVVLPLQLPPGLPLRSAALPSIPPLPLLQIPRGPPALLPIEQVFPLPLPHMIIRHYFKLLQLSQSSRVQVGALMEPLLLPVRIIS